MHPCHCCAASRRLAAVLVRRLDTDDPGASSMFNYDDEIARICESCFEWLTSLLQAILRGQKQEHHLLGMPAGEGRVMLFAGQCHLCRSLPADGVTRIECQPLYPAVAGWQGLELCPACETWLVSIAHDGRSARGDAAREVDGAYGEWLHPNLRFLHVALDIRDASVAAAIQHACDSMGIETCDPTEMSPGAILFFEVGPRAHINTPMLAPYAATIAVAPLGARAELLESLATGASDWLTAPVTPQQVTAALTRVPSRWQHPAVHDPFTALPVIETLPGDRALFVVEPLRGVHLFELVWLLKRYSRGYDELGVTRGGQIVFLPRARNEQLSAVASRLSIILKGRCTLVEPVRAPAAKRLDATG